VTIARAINEKQFASFVTMSTEVDYLRFVTQERWNQLIRPEMFYLLASETSTPGCRSEAILYELHFPLKLQRCSIMRTR